MQHLKATDLRSFLMIGLCGISLNVVAVDAPEKKSSIDGLELIKTELSTVTVRDVKADAVRLPLQTRQVLLAKPDSIKRLAGTLYIHRVLAKQAEDMGLDKRPDIELALRLARDKILADARLVVADGDEPDMNAVDKQAQILYKQNIDKFTEPSQRKLSHILISKDREDAKERAENILKRIKAGEDFATLAKEFSDDPGSGKRGGDLGVVPPGRTVKPFEFAAFSMKNVGDISGLVGTQFGLHIIKLDEIIPENIKPYETVKNELYVDVKRSVSTDRREVIVGPVRASIQYDDAALQAFASEYGAEQPVKPAKP